MSAKRIDVISDTHGHLSHELVDALEGCDLIIHAGDMTSDADFYTLQAIAPLKMCLGNNDWAGEYGPDITKKAQFEYEGLYFVATHYYEQLLQSATQTKYDVGIFGHTHVPVCRELDSGVLLMNPGSPTFPRSEEGPTMGRIVVEDGRVLSSEIIHLGSQRESSGTSWIGSFLNW